MQARVSTMAAEPLLHEAPGMDESTTTEAPAEPRKLTITTAVGAALVGGVFFGFSTFIMKALRKLPPEQGIAAMQSMNEEAPNGLFMTALFGSALTGGALSASALRDLDSPGARLRLVGGALSTVAAVTTVGYHIPRNNALAELDPGSAYAPEFWTRFEKGWTSWNHLRTVAPVVGAVALVVSLRRR